MRMNTREKDTMSDMEKREAPMYMSLIWVSFTV